MIPGCRDGAHPLAGGCLWSLLRIKMICQLRPGEGSSFIQITGHISLDYFFAFYVDIVSFWSSQLALPLGEKFYGGFTESQPVYSHLLNFGYSSQAYLVQMLIISCHL